MDDHDDPYEILGVSNDATEAEIKKAYKKMALKHHPDKQSTEEGRVKATAIFAKISNAYEIIGDATQRANYDREASRGRGAGANRPWCKMPRRSRHNDSAQDDFFHHTTFHDPFAVFESFFRGEGFGDDFFANPFGHMQHQQQQQRGNNNMRGQSIFDDPFFSHGGRSMFNDPFFGGMGGFGSDPFFGGGMMRSPLGGSLFDVMNQHATNMNQLPQGQSFVYSSSSCTNMLGGETGESVTTSTTTRIINGKRQVVTERIVRKADGTVERCVDQSQDEGFPPQPPQRRLMDQGTTLQALPPPGAATQRESSRSKEGKPKSKRSIFKRKRRDRGV